MIISVAELRTHISTELSDAVLEAKLLAIESLIRAQTNNNFQNRRIRCYSAIEDGVITTPSPYFRIGDTVQISESSINDGLYVIGNGYELDPIPWDEKKNLITKIEYPADVKLGVIDIIKWQIKNDERNSGDTDKKDIQSETISRHSVTYATDATETDIDVRLGVPKKYTSFLKPYTKARF